ncbi:diadenylate cyclase CdaA [Candidatus Soleaferrea massiliensis]|uniref:diadenylate cyclase CdaA n=1 Tax=Candidatus Soleaferrea massiliensis TaxID=1470354 RepID=UPI00058F81C1|nr:diadenylate cyclase CdaA [Candidatus Soleaferrea massiliensis]
MDIWSSFVNVLKTFQLIDAVDVICVAFLIYQGIKLVRETRAEQLVKGLLFLIIPFFIATQFELKMMSFIFQNLFQFGVITLLIVFQPELRRALEQMGRSRISRFKLFGSNQQISEETEERWRIAIDAIVDACTSFSKSKTGALIVVEEETKLGEYIKTGTVIDAEPSKELIGNIFFVNSPLHDGAMVVRYGKLFAAGCFLPLSTNQSISRELGTRHRAALGMSENSDAMVIIVSEETGYISIAHDGVLTRNITPETLRFSLEEELFPSRKQSETAEKKAFWKVRKK